LKRIGIGAVPAALAKAERYRLLNQPRQAESICLDVLHVDPRNQEAWTTLLLAQTDQFGRGYGVDIRQAREALEHLEDAYARVYYDGVLNERWGKSLLAGSAPRQVGCDWLRQAMGLFERAAALSPAGNDDALLRWNACARLILYVEGNAGPAGADEQEAFLDAPPS
jgi:hypothetical protein